MAVNKRLQRKTQTRSEKKRTLGGSSAQAQRLHETEPFKILDAFIESKGKFPSSLYLELRKMAGASPTTAWKAANNVYEAMAFGHWPSPLPEADLNILKGRYRASHPEILDYLEIQDYADVKDWDDPQNTLLQTYQKNKLPLGSHLSLPVIAHFFSKGWLDPTSHAVNSLLRSIDFFVEELTEFEVEDFSKLLHFLGTTCPRPKLVKLEKALHRLAREAKYNPLFVEFIKPTIAGIIKRYYQSPKLNLDKFPGIRSYLEEKMPAENALSSFQWDDPSKISYAQLEPELVLEKNLAGEVAKNYRVFIKKQLVAWRFWAEGQATRQHPDFISQEERIFKSLWAALSHGVPAQEKEFAKKTKDVCGEFFMKLLTSPNYRPMPSIIMEFVKLDPNNDSYRWLLFAAKGFSDRTLSAKPQSGPKIMPFSIFYNLYVHHKLAQRSEFISHYFIPLPRESQREILAQWFHRAQTNLDTHAKLSEFSKLTFDKLLDAQRFPVAGLESALDTDPAILVWSLAYLKFKKQPCPAIGYEKTLAVFDYLHKISAPVFFHAYGADFVIDLLPQVCLAEGYKLGLMGRLVDLVTKYQNILLEKALERGLKDLFKAAPQGDLELLIKALPSTAAKQKDKVSQRRKRSGPSRDRESLQF